MYARSRSSRIRRIPATSSIWRSDWPSFAHSSLDTIVSSALATNSGTPSTSTRLDERGQVFGSRTMRRKLSRVVVTAATEAAFRVAAGTAEALAEARPWSRSGAAFAIGQSPALAPPGSCPWRCSTARHRQVYAGRQAERPRPERWCPEMTTHRRYHMRRGCKIFATPRSLLKEMRVHAGSAHDVGANATWLDRKLCPAQALLPS